MSDHDEPGPVRRALAFEAGIWVSLARWVLRRPDVEPGAAPFGYAESLTPLFVAFIGASAVEVPVAHLIVAWPAVRVVVLVLGVWGLLWMVGFLASMRVRPHAVGPAGIRVRYGVGIDVRLAWDEIDQVRLRSRTMPSSRTVHLDRTEGAAAPIAVSSQTTVDVLLREPTLVRLPKVGVERVTAVHFHADDPRALMAQIRRSVPRSHDHGRP